MNCSSVPLFCGLLLYDMLCVTITTLYIIIYRVGRTRKLLIAGHKVYANAPVARRPDGRTDPCAAIARSRVYFWKQAPKPLAIRASTT